MVTRKVTKGSNSRTMKAMADRNHPRLILHNFISFEECKELEFIHKSCSTVGYRPNVLSTTLSHLIATNSAHLVMPFIPIRERLKEKVEEFFGCEYELFVEFTGLISWVCGASIGWHSDDNRPYLKQRDFTAVCYLNTYEKDFKGGLFHFQDGEPKTIAPIGGDVVIYTADNSNTHGVDEISGGERLTLTLWFSRDSSHDEDTKLISRLSQSSLHNNISWLPSPASINMYWFSLGQATSDKEGFDVCWARLHVLGFDVLYSQDESLPSDISELLMEPLRLAWKYEFFDYEFTNILHALQVVQYFHWKASELRATEVKIGSKKVGKLSKSQENKIKSHKVLFLKDYHLAETILGPLSCYSSLNQRFDWADFAAAIALWEGYACKLHQQITTSLAHWKSHQSMFTISFDRN